MSKMDNVIIIKKDGTKEPYNGQKIITAIGKSASRIMVKLTSDENKAILNHVENAIINRGENEVPIALMHNMVESALVSVNEEVAKSYRDYRNYKKEFVHMMDDVFVKSQSIRYIGDKENANTDSSLVATKRSLIFNELNKNLYRKFFMTRDELQACKEGYIYVHDQSARLDTINCCLFNASEVMSGGFEMGNVWYNEPKSLDTAWDVLGDLILSTAAQQYGGFTVPEVDKVLAPYAKKSYEKYLKEYYNLMSDVISKDFVSSLKEKAEKYAMKKTQREMEQGYQGIEYKLNTVGSSRGDYPFVTFTFGLGTEVFERMCSKTILQVHEKGQGKEGFKRPVLFPKLVFLYDKNIHDIGKINEDVFEAGISCSSKTMYPDWLSMSGNGYISNMYKKYKRVISPMGCRAFLSPWYEKGGMNPADENDKPVFVGRCNLGAISLHLPMILAKARRDSKDFYEVLDYYMELIRNLHKRTYDYIGELRASVNPIMFCEGGLYGGHLKPNEKIRSLLPPMTMSYGITALNELQELYNGKSLVEDNKFALEVMQYINDKLAKYKEKDHILYAVYGTPAENLAGLQVKQFRKEFGIVHNVSDREYVTNSFHCHVTENITPIQKQNLEYDFWDLFNGGKIQYVRYTLGYNKDAIRTLVKRAMDMGYYEGVNLALSYCDDCGYQAVDIGDECPVCGSKNLTKIDRMNGYLAYSRRNGESRMSDSKMAEIEERKSM